MSCPQKCSCIGCWFLTFAPFWFIKVLKPESIAVRDTISAFRNSILVSKT